MISHQDNVNSIKQVVNEIHRPARVRGFPRRPFVMIGIDETWQADINDLNNIKEFNDGKRFILVVIDVFSKFAFARELNSKNGKDVSNAFNSIVQESGRCPR